MFLTAKTRLEQTDDKGKWITLDNQLYEDKDGSIYLVPRNYKTDGYTIPCWIAWLGGSKMDYDTRCSTQHDFECEYAKVIRVNLPEFELKKKKYLQLYKNKWICEDIPIKYLSVEKTTFNQTNNRFKRMLIECGSIPRWRVNMMRFAVNFNFGWHSNKNEIDLKNLYVKK